MSVLSVAIIAVIVCGAYAVAVSAFLRQQRHVAEQTNGNQTTAHARGHITPINELTPSERAALERIIWVFLAVLAMGWGIATGISLGGDSLLDPAAGLIGCLGILVLVITMAAAQQHKAQTRGDS